MDGRFFILLAAMPKGYIKLPCDSCSMSQLVRSELTGTPAQVSSCCCCTVCPSDGWKEHDDTSKTAGHVPSTSLRKGGGPVCVALILRKAKHRRPNIAKQWSNGNGWREEGETLRALVWIQEEEEERGEEMTLCFLSQAPQARALNHFMTPEWKYRLDSLLRTT